jgi:hypothetical protein
MSRSATVPTAAGTFSPLRTGLRLDNRSYSPAVLQLMAEAVGRLSSFADAAFALSLARISISSRHLGRIAGAIGNDLAGQRDEKVVRRRRRQLPARVAAPPEAVAVEVDGGRLRTRAAGCGPGVHQPQSKEEKIACLVNLHSTTHEDDPQPEPPESLLQPRRVQRLVQQMKGHAGEQPAEPAEAEDPPVPVPAPVPEKCPQVKAKERVRTCLASMVNSESFGPMMAAAAQERDFYRAKRRAFVGDGAAYNWSIQQGYFPDFEPITDLLHVLCYLYLAAWAVGPDEAARWSIYVGWLGACWQGRVSEVIEELRLGQQQIGAPPEGEELEQKDPRRLVAEALSYLENNQSRMDYPRYRRQGLPITSSLVESLVGEFNSRVKGREKFWNRPDGAEPILQLRAAVLSEDDALSRHFAQRPGNPHRRRRKAS